MLSFVHGHIHGELLTTQCKSGQWWRPFAKGSGNPALGAADAKIMRAFVTHLSMSAFSR